MDNTLPLIDEITEVNHEIFDEVTMGVDPDLVKKEEEKEEENDGKVQ